MIKQTVSFKRDNIRIIEQIQKQNECDFSLRDIWLCHVCSETREMWKKTGAWFYNSLPSYRRQQRVSNIRKTGISLSTRPERSTNRGMKVTDSSSDEYDEEFTNNGETGPNPRCSSIGVKRNTSYFSDRMNSFRPRASTSTSSLNDESFFYRKLSSFNLFGRSPSTIKCDTDSNVFFPDNDTVAVTESITNLRCDSLPSTCSTSETSSTNDTNILLSNSITHQICREQPMGWLEISLTYSEIDHTLDCFLIRARDLSTIDITSPIDPFARLNIVTQYDKLKQLKWMQTRTVHNTRCPEFNEIVQFFGVEPDELATSILYVVILDEDKFGSDFLGTAKIQLKLVNLTI